jgi:predicted DCC family thiol-disulfide oxidoreductase YuxK
VADAPAPTFLYDGDCSFCSTCADFIQRRVPTRAQVVPWQFADLAALGVTQEAAEAAVQWVDGTGRPAAAGPEGIARLLVDAGSFWRPLGWVLGFAPVRALAWPVYRLISRNRHRLPGGTAACSLPQAQRDARRAAAAAATVDAPVPGDAPAPVSAEGPADTPAPT